MRPSVMITYPSSLYFWLHYDGFRLEKHMQKMKEISLNNKFLVNEYDVGSIGTLLGLPHPISLIGAKTTTNKHLRRNYYYVRQTSIPPNSFYKISLSAFPFDILLASPEYTFLKASKDLPLASLAELACNLSATYYLDPTAKFKQSSRKKISSISKISEYLITANNMHGIKESLHALRYALDNSNSPMESKLAVLGILPFSLGGYSLRIPELNAIIPLNLKAANLLACESCRGDMVWQNQKVVLEYDSNLTHLSPEQHAYDKRRQTALSLSGYHLISATAEDIRNLNSLDAFFKIVRKTLGQRAEFAKYDKYRNQRFNTVKALLRK